MNRWRAIALSSLLLTGSIPVWSGLAAECMPRMQAAPRACCGPHCTCAASSACVCRSRPAPAPPSPLQGALESTTIELRCGLEAIAGTAAHPAAPADAAALTRLGFGYAPDPAASRRPLRRLELLVMLQV